MPPWTDFFPWRDQYGRGVFIAYRRGGDRKTARAIKSELERRGYRIFLDVDDLGAGPFDESLLAHIEAARNFIVILSRSSLARCVESGDWLRREIAHAISTSRIIVPLVKEDFEFSELDGLPHELSSLPRDGAASPGIVVPTGPGNQIRDRGSENYAGLSEVTAPRGPPAIRGVPQFRQGSLCPGHRLLG